MNMSIFSKLKNRLFPAKLVVSPTQQHSTKIRVLVVEFLDASEDDSGRILVEKLQDKKDLEVYYLNEYFDKSFLNLDGKDLFDWYDKGLSILQNAKADVLIWGCREGNKIRLNFQSNNFYECNHNVFTSIMDSLYIPKSFHFSNLETESFLLDLIHGICVSSSSLSHSQKQELLLPIIDNIKLKHHNTVNDQDIYSQNMLGLIYLSYYFDSQDKEIINHIKKTFEQNLSHLDLTQHYILAGCTYYHLGQLLDCAANHLPNNSSTYYKGGIEYYLQAQKYLNKFNFPYPFGAICYRLSNLYFNYWKLKSDTQDLREAIFYLQEAEKIYTQTVFPNFWSNIQENLGYLLSILGNQSNSIDICNLAISRYQNVQKVMSQSSDPIAWAIAQSEIGHIYYLLGKANNNTKFLDSSLKCFQDALCIFENMSSSENLKKTQRSLDKIKQLTRQL